MDLTEILDELAPKLPSLAEEDRVIVAPLVDHMRAGVIRPVTEEERLVLIRLGGGAQ
ncbi:hypothetical protein PQR64_23100 [Paraburkholderia phytofirmans]|uniref:hypothetical protein n=1 Tax=Paraburkholderia phytofirmans TaxID=261302 RepID=UPI0038B97CF2